MQMKGYCEREDVMNPFFVQKNVMHQDVMDRLKEADVTSF